MWRLLNVEIADFKEKVIELSGLESVCIWNHNYSEPIEKLFTILLSMIHL